MRALAVVNCQSAFEWCLLRSARQAAISSVSVGVFGMRDPIVEQQELLRGLACQTDRCE
jgi:hypothetical protein